MLRTDADCLDVTVLAWGWHWLAMQKILHAVQKISHAVRKISHTEQKCFFFLNKMWKTSKGKFTVSSLVYCLVRPFVCPLYIYGKSLKITLRNYYTNKLISPKPDFRFNSNYAGTVQLISFTCIPNLKKNSHTFTTLCLCKLPKS